MIGKVKIKILNVCLLACSLLRCEWYSASTECQLHAKQEGLPLVIGHYSNTNIHIIMFEAKFSGVPLVKSDNSANISVIIVLDLIESGPLFSDV